MKLGKDLWWTPTIIEAQLSIISISISYFSILTKYNVNSKDYEQNKLPSIHSLHIRKYNHVIELRY